MPATGNAIRALCVFCGSSPGNKPQYAEAAENLGQALARRGIGLVFGGGSVGLMGVVSRAARDAGGKVVGVIPGALTRREPAQPGLTQLHVVDSMHERKALMAQESDGFIAMPGGYGTMEELFEVLTWAQLGIHKKPVALLDVDGYWEPLVAMLDHMVTEGFVKPSQRSLVMVETDADRLIDLMQDYVPPVLTPWISGDKT